MSTAFNECATAMPIHVKDLDDIVVSSSLSSPYNDHYNEASAPIKSESEINHSIITTTITNTDKPDKTASILSETNNKFINTTGVKDGQIRNASISNKSTSEEKLCAYTLILHWYKAIASYIFQANHDGTVNNLIYWKDPVHSGLVLFSTLSLILALKYWSTLAVLSLCILSVILLVGIYKFTGALAESIFGYSLPDLPTFISQEWKIDHSSDGKITSIITSCNNLLKWMQNILLWNEVIPSLLVLGFVFISFNVGRSFDTLTILFIKILFLFTIPYLYSKNEQHLNSVRKSLKTYFDNTKESIFAKIPYFGRTHGTCNGPLKND